MTRWVVLVFGVAVLLAACDAAPIPGQSAVGTTLETAPRVADSVPPLPASTASEAAATTIPIIVIPECPADAECGVDFLIGAERWGVSSCLSLKQESVGAQVLATGPAHNVVDEVRRIEGVDPVLMVAAHPTEVFGCFEDTSDDTDRWIAAFGSSNAGTDGVAAMALARAICDHAVEVDIDDECDGDRVIEWTLVSDPGYELRYEYFSVYQDQIEASLAEGNGPGWRLDPTETAFRHWVNEHRLCIEEFSANNYPRCRVGLRPASVAGDMATVAVVFQWAMPMETDQVLFYETIPMRLTVERSGLAWWVTGYTEGPPILHGDSAQGRAASDQLWEECCSVVVVDTEQGTQPEPETSSLNE